MSTNETAGRLPPELATPVTDLSKAVQGEPLTLQQIYERVAGSDSDPAPDATLTREPVSSDDVYQVNVGVLFPRGPVVASEMGVISQAAYDELERVLAERVAEINQSTTPAQENTMASQQSIEQTRTPTSIPGTTATEAGKRADTAAAIQRRSLMENVSDAHNATRAAVNAMTDLISKMFGAEAAKASAESYTGIGPMPAMEAGVVVNVEYMLRDIAEMTQKIEAQARVVSGELG